MWFLFACTPDLTVDGVKDTLRTAMRIEREDDTVGLYWFSNTPVGCEPEIVEDDPTTQPDEEADAYTWWEAQVATAFAREDGMNVVVVTGAPGDGDFNAGWNLSTLAADQAVVGWFRVTEASLTEMSDYWLVYEVTDYNSGLGVGTVGVEGDRVTIDTDDSGPALDAPVEACTFIGMRNLLQSLIQPWLGSATGG